MKKKFLSIFVALTLAATMFSTTLAFAETQTITVPDKEGFPVTNITYTRTATDELVFSFTVDRAGSFVFELGDTPDEDGNSQLIGRNYIDIEAGDHTWTTYIFIPGYPFISNDAFAGTLSFRFIDEGVYVAGPESLTLPALNEPIEESTSLPVEEVVASETTETAKSLIPKSGDENRTVGMVMLLASLAVAGVSFRALRKEQTKA